MPSDVRQDRDPGLDRALRAVGGAIDDFHSAVSRTVDELRTELASRGEPAAAERRRVAELGPMANGRIDTDRWATVMTEPDWLGAEDAEHLRDALFALEAVEDAGSEPFVIEVGEEEGLGQAVEEALAWLGRAFGAARTAELVRTGRFRAAEHGEMTDGFPARLWNRAERGIAPPLVVRVPGEKLSAGSLVPYLDGSQKIVLLVEGAAPPAALVRLVTPGVLVLQATDPEELDRLAAWDGTAVAGVFSSGCGAARFLHDPSGGAALARRVTVEEAPDAQGLRPVGRWTVAQQLEELGQLLALADAAPVAPAPSENGDGEAAEEEVQPADRLAAWLLRQANLRDLDGGS